MAEGDTKAVENGGQGAKKKRTRSPLYPSFDLQQAIERAQQIHDDATRHAVSLDAAAESWGVKPTSSTVLQAVSTLKQFGLIQDTGSGEGRNVQLTDTALDVLLHEEGTPERTAAIKGAALTPKLHAELWAMYGGDLPTADGPIRSYLLRHKKFNPAAVSEFIDQFRRTILFANLTKDDKVSDDENNENPAEPLDRPLNHWDSSVPPSAKSASQPSIANPAPGTATFRELPVTLPTSLAVAVFRLPVPMSQEDFKTLVNTLNAMEKSLVKKEGKATD